MASGLALKSVALFLRTIEFCCAAIILSIFSYFLATLHNHGLHIATYIRAVEGISGAAVIYTIFALLLVCCLGGIAFFSLLGIILDVAFTGAFIYVAWATRHGDGSCNGNVITPFGSGNTYVDNTVSNGKGGFTSLPSLHQACQLQTACFAVAIVGLVFFLLSIPIEYTLIRHRRKERAFGPSPNNNYTSGSPKRRFWRRKPKHDAPLGEKNPDALPVHATPADIRTSYATDTTAVGAAGEVPLNKYANSAGYDNAGYGQMGGTTTANGWQTTTTTHSGVPTNDGYVRSHQPYNANPTGTF